MDPKNDRVLVHDMDRLWSDSVPVEMIVDETHADAAGSNLGDENALRQMLGQLIGKSRGD